MSVKYMNHWLYKCPLTLQIIENGTDPQCTFWDPHLDGTGNAFRLVTEFSQLQL